MDARFILLLAVACSAPARDGVVHGSHPPGHPVADLAPVWQLDESAAAVFADRESLVVLINEPGGARPVRSIDQRDGYESPRLESGDLRWADNPVFDASRVAFMSLATKHITLVDLPRGDDAIATRWHQPIGRDPSVSRIAIDRDRVYAGFVPDLAKPRVELIGFDAHDGQLRWRRELWDHATTVALDGGPQPIAAGRISHPSPEPGEAFALRFDPDTGATAWLYRGPAALAIAVDPDRVVFARAATLVVVDRKTGDARELRAPDLAGGTVPELAIRDGVAYVASWLPDATGAIAFAIGLDDGGVRWRRALPTSHSELVTAHAVYVLTTGGVIHALDRATGNPVWEWSTGKPWHVRLVAGTRGDERIFVVGETTLTAFAARRPPPAFEDAVIRGRLVVACGKPSGHDFEIGDAEVAPRRSGEFEVRVRARGRLYVHPPGAADGEDLELTGRGEYRLGIVDASDCRGP